VKLWQNKNSAYLRRRCWFNVAADGALNEGGKVTQSFRFLQSKEIAHKQLTELLGKPCMSEKPK
jgi:hypothetical protein